MTSNNSTHSPKEPSNSYGHVMNFFDDHGYGIAVVGLMGATLVLVGFGGYSLPEVGAAFVGPVSSILVAKLAGLGRMPGLCFVLLLFAAYAATLILLLNGYATTLDTTLYNGGVSLLIIPSVLA
ncbi:hypothetical protein ACWGI9_45055 [Streptomyces sp. NPDC054833]